MQTSIPVIDLFAGPGGLGEGFASFRRDGSRRPPFKIRLSVEKDPYAHQTLELRSFYRQFVYLDVPEEYYQYLRGQLTRTELFERYPHQAKAAREEARLAELGTQDNENINRWIEERLSKCSSKNWVLIGGPPCQAYSVIGRSRMRSGDPEKFDKDHRHFLYREYLRIIAGFRPSVFVMENVTGILSATVGSEHIFERILSDLKQPVAALLEHNDPGQVSIIGDATDNQLEYHVYSLVAGKNAEDKCKPTEFIIKAEDYGIPQARHRVILLGVRKDLQAAPNGLTRYESPVTAGSVLRDLPKLRSRLSRQEDNDEDWRKVIRSLTDHPWYAALAQNNNNLFIKDLACSVERAANTMPAGLPIGGEFVPCSIKSFYRPDWFHDPRLGGICNHTARAHMGEDLHRYLFASCFAKTYGYSPTIADFPEALRPKHKNINAAISADHFDDRFRVQIEERPATTIVSHMAKDGHYTIHYDPLQCRSMTVREAARLQTFPDNYFFEGSRTQQYKQVGNAVPPLLASQIAGLVYNLMEVIHGAQRRQHSPVPQSSSGLVADKS